MGSADKSKALLLRKSDDTKQALAF